MDKNQLYLAMRLREERKSRGLQLKELASGICAASYLSKIERGEVSPSAELLSQLLERLDISCETDESFLRRMGELIREAYDALYFNWDHRMLFKRLGEAEARLLNSPYRFAYLIYKAYLEEKWDPSLAVLSPYFERECLALYKLTYLQSRDMSDLDCARELPGLFQNSFGKMAYMRSCLAHSRYEEIKSLGESCLATAAEEGNLYRLIEGNRLLGIAYASESHLGQALRYFKCAEGLIRGSIWQQEISSVYYNLGATYLELGELKEAAAYLRRLPHSFGFMRHHKMACLALQENAVEQATKELRLMEVTAGQDALYLLLCKSVRMQCRPGFAEEPESLQTVRELIRYLRGHMHLGYLRFHRELAVKVLSAHRLYKEALELERLLLTRDYAAGL